MKRWQFRAIPLRSFQLVEGNAFHEAIGIFAAYFGLDNSTIVQWKRAGDGDRRVRLRCGDVGIRPRGQCRNV